MSDSNAAQPAATGSRRAPRTGFLGRDAGRRAHLHIENVSSLGAVFEVTPARLEAALGRHPALAGKVEITVGRDGDILAEEMKTADALFGWGFDRAQVAKAPHLRWVAAHGAGVSHLMPLDWLPPGAVLTNSRGVHGPKADEYTIMALLMLNNNLPQSFTNQRRAHWEQPFSTAISGKTLLIVGVGHVGGGAATWAKRFGLHVIGIRRSGKPHRAVDEMHCPEALHDLLPRADFVLVTAPDTADSHRMIGRTEIGLLKRGAGLINYSRAGLVDYDALSERLARGEVSAMLDVFDPEPLPASSPLWHVPNLIITPHCSSDDRELYTPRTLDLVFDNLERFLAGKELRCRVDPRRQY
jgi:glyoxylate/hydroxypyruvate reductase A